MSKYTKYKLYQKYETRGSQEAIPCYPSVFSIDGDGTMPLVIVEENSRDCGYTGETQPIYRWYTMPITSYYVCDECDSQSYESQYLTLVAKGDGMFQKVNHSETFQYSKDEGNSWTNATSATTIYVRNGDRVMFKGTLTPNSSGGVGNFSASITFEAEGNPMSLLFGDNFIGKTSLSGKDYAFYGLFANNTNLIGISNLSLLATTLASQCYQGMFMDCSSLTSIPSNLLPASTLAHACYDSMFNGCTSLTTAPELPATTLADMSYGSMFYGCTSLTTAPVLLATTLANYCYAGMFLGCTSLTTAPSLPATILTEGCYRSMFQDCTSLTTVPNLLATTMANWCYQYMFNGCTSLTTVPSNLLPASTLSHACYDGMFAYCASLTTAPVLSATTLTDYCYQYMFKDCTSLTTAPDLIATTLTEGCYAFMFNGCSSLNYIKCLATDISASYCTTSWLENVSSSGTFVKKSSMSGWSSGDDGIPTNWTVQNA